MKTIETMPGEHISTVAERLVANAPACAMFNGIRIRARYATTVPADVVRQYDWTLELRTITRRHSPAGKAEAARVEASAREAQAIVDEHVAALETLDLEDVAAVLAWVSGIADAADHVGTTYDHPPIVEHFAAGGWTAGANCGPDFVENDARNFAGWIVGQWLASRYPGVQRFVDDWRARFLEPVN